MNNSASEMPEGIPDDFAAQAQALWNDTLLWIWHHGLQILIGSAIAFLIVLALLGAKAFGLRLCATDSGRNSWRTTLGSMLSKTRLWFMIAIAAKLVASYANAPSLVAQTVTFLFTVAAAFQVALWVRELALGMIEHRAGGIEDSTSLGSAMGIIRLLVSIAIFAIALVVILDNLGVNVTGLIAGLGIGGIAIGLAAQGIFSDLFAALSIIFDKPFRRGDAIGFGAIGGAVETIGLKSTRIRSNDGEEIVISNAKLLGDQIQNFTHLRRRRSVMQFSIVYQTPPDVLAAIPGEVRKIVEAQKHGVYDRCHAFRFGPSSIDYEMVFFVASSDFGVFADARQAIILAIIRRFAEIGAQFAYPTQTTFTAAPDGTLVMPYPEPAKT